MKRYRIVCPLAVWLLLSTWAALAQEPISYNFRILKVNDIPARKLMPVKDWREFAKNNNAVVLEDIGGTTSANSEALGFSGAKRPLSYLDPRSGGSQVQYIDLGTKIDVNFKPVEDGQFEVEARGERSADNAHPQCKDRASAVIFESETVMKRGQAAIFGSARGPMIERAFKEQFPAGTFDSNDWIVLVLTLE